MTDQLTDLQLDLLYMLPADRAAAPSLKELVAELGGVGTRLELRQLIQAVNAAGIRVHTGRSGNRTDCAWLDKRDLERVKRMIEESTYKGVS